jgi:hypothetical protein
MKMKNLLLTIAATLGMTALTMAQNVPNYVPTNGLVGWWPFNGNANDESGNNNNGTVNGATLTSDRFGNLNSAFDFDGINDFISINNTFDLSTRSFNFWFNPSVINASTGTLLVSDNPTLVNGVTQARVIKLNNLDSVQVATGTTVGFYIGAGTTINNWQMLTYTRNINDVKIYLNGILINSGQSGFYTSGNGNIQTILGCDRNLTFDWYNGKIDDLGVWNRTLTNQEITDLYNGNICFQTITVTDTLLINMGITGFNPVTYNNTIKIFPNPTNDHITIDYGNFASLNGYQLKIINSLSQQVFQTSITQQSNYLNLTTWGGNGLYFVQIIDPQGNIIDIRKIVLQ